jgi:hypothetical protein
MVELSTFTGDTSGDTTSSSASSARSSNWSEGIADVPSYNHEEYAERSSESYYTLEEHWTRLTHYLMEQQQRFYFVKRRGKRAVPAATPWVQERRIPDKDYEAAEILNEFIKPYALPVEEIDKRLQANVEALFARALETYTKRYLDDEPGVPMADDDF